MYKVIVTDRLKWSSFKFEPIGCNEIAFCQELSIRFVSIPGFLLKSKYKISHAYIINMNDIEKQLILKNEGNVLVVEGGSITETGYWPLEQRCESRELYCGDGRIVSSCANGIELFDVFSSNKKHIYDRSRDNADLYISLLNANKSTVFFLEYERQKNAQPIVFKTIDFSGNVIDSFVTSESFEFGEARIPIRVNDNVLFWATDTACSADGKTKVRLFSVDMNGNVYRGDFLPVYNSGFGFVSAASKRYITVDCTDFSKADDFLEELYVYRVDDLKCIGKVSADELTEDYDINPISACMFISENEFLLGTWNETLLCRIEG